MSAMSFNTVADKFWVIFTWTCITAIVVGACWWGHSRRAPDLPFAAWLASASRDDVWIYGFTIVACGVAVGRFVVRSSPK